MISPTQRARLVIRHAWLAGGGEPVTRADVLDSLDVPTPVTPVEAEPVSPNQPPITPSTAGQAAEVVSFTEAAVRLGVSVATARRYAAPSSGRLIRLGDGVTRASLENLAVTR